MTFDLGTWWGIAQFIGLLTLVAVVFAGVGMLWDWLADRRMLKRVDRHASEQWRKRHAEKEKHDGWMG